MEITVPQTQATAPAASRRAPAPEGSRNFVGDALLVRVGGGDQAAFASLYDHLAPAAFGLARRVVRDEALAEEIIQDAFLQVWSTGSSFDQTRGSAQSWVLTIVHRRSVDVVRHEQSARERSLRVGVRSFDLPFDSVWTTALQHEERAQVCRAVMTISQPQQQAIELAYYCGMTCGEVADHLAIPAETAKSHILEGIRRLRRALAASER